MTKKSGLFIIISSPTGGGKDTVISEILKIIPNSQRLVTTTSRLPRPTDKEGLAYHFISREDFEQKIKEGYFLEYNNFADNYYGTPKIHLAEMLEKNECVLSNLDVNGKHSMDTLGIKNTSIFLLPENMETLIKRAQARGGITQEMIDKRIQIAEQEIAQSKDYDYQITNYEGKLDQTVAAVAQIIRKHIGLVDKK